MRFSNQNQATLDSLAAALGRGLPSSTAYPILQQTIQQQEMQNQARAQQLQAYGQQVAEMATGGMPQAQATTMMDLLTPRPGIPGRVENMLQQAYPGPSGLPPGNAIAPPSEQQYWTPAFPEGAAQSPLFLDNPQVQLQQAMQEAEYESAVAPPAPTADQQKTEAIGDIIRFIREERAQGKDNNTIMQEVYQAGFGGLLAAEWDTISPWLSEANPLDTAQAMLPIGG